LFRLTSISMQPSQSAGTSKGVWFFYVWFFSCLCLYLFKIPINLSADFQNFWSSIQSCSWSWNQLFSNFGSHLLTLLLGFGYLMLFWHREVLLKRFELSLTSMALGLVSGFGFSFLGIIGRKLGAKRTVLYCLTTKFKRCGG